MFQESKYKKSKRIKDFDIFYEFQLKLNMQNIWNLSMVAPQ